MNARSCHAFVDESGNHTLSKKDGASPYFVLCVILVEEEQLEAATEGARVIRKRHFQTGEMKSMKIADNITRRLRVMRDLLELPIGIAAFVVDKHAVFLDSGLRYKAVFHKYLHGRVYRRLTRYYSDIAITADGHGNQEFMEGFKLYIEGKCLDLFPDARFRHTESKGDVLVQTADVFAGSIAKAFEAKSGESVRDLIFETLKGKLLELDLWPRKYHERISRKIDSVVESGDDGRVREYCFRAVDSYLGSSFLEADDHSDIRSAVLDCLANEAVSEDDRYVSAAALVSRLNEAGFREINEDFLRTKVISHFRDHGIIIASSSKGYKIPTSIRDVHDYVGHCASIICPMRERLNKARKAIRLVTHGREDILENNALEFLKADFSEFGDSANLGE